MSFWAVIFIVLMLIWLFGGGYAIYSVPGPSPSHVAFFGGTLLSAGLVCLTWPLVFSAPFTEWVFGAPRPVFWKLFLLFVVAGALARLLRPRK